MNKYENVQLEYKMTHWIWLSAYEWTESRFLQSFG